MKQRLSLSDIENLSFKQQDSLRRVWMPERYDIAVSKICVNAETDEYRWIECAIGDINVVGDDMVLSDLRVTDGFSKIYHSETADAEDFMIQEPASFRKSESLPLLTLGELIGMLSLLDKRKYHFYLLSGNDKYACEIGDFNSEMKAGILSKSDLNADLVDVLWTLLKTIL
jgi:hypothetical protein